MSSSRPKPIGRKTTKAGEPSYVHDTCWMRVGRETAGIPNALGLPGQARLSAITNAIARVVRVEAYMAGKEAR